jgi:hypothetical protein
LAPSVSNRSCPGKAHARTNARPRRDGPRTDRTNTCGQTFARTASTHQRAGAPTDFKAKRAAVVSRLRPDSWITVRACNFGQTQAGMYALCSFFGGNANAYAPMLYSDRLAVHGHLVRQRLEPKDVHTPDPQDAVVRALADPGAFARAVCCVHRAARRRRVARVGGPGAGFAPGPPPGG